MVRFLVLREYPKMIQKRLDEWSEEHPDVSLEFIDCSYTIEEDGMWHLILAYEDD